jgi:hypothetical protein
VLRRNRDRVGQRPLLTLLLQLNVRPILPRQRIGFGVRLHKLADEAGTSMLDLQGDCELQPILNVIGKSGGSWKGQVVGKPVPARIESPPQMPRSAR